MKNLWAPWRMQYVVGEKESGCVFCRIQAEKNDRDNYILFRGNSNFVTLNKYPYNAGHLMVIPVKHIAQLNELSDAELTEHFRLVNKCTKVLIDRLKPQGFNIGLNLGEAAGAGIKDHLHTHVVPRWTGDTNFMPVVAEAKVISSSLADIYDTLVDVFAD